jgi:hypothetical protein
MNNYVLWISIGIILYAGFYIAWVLYQNRLMRKLAETGILLEVVLEKDSEVNPFDIEQLWTNFHGFYLPWYRRLFKAQPYLSFEIKSEHSLKRGKRIKEITFNFWIPEEYRSMVEDRIRASYPTAQISLLGKDKDYMPNQFDTDRVIETAELGLREHSAFSIKTFEDYESDPLTSITSSLSSIEEQEIAIIQVVTRPISRSWNERAHRVLARYERSSRKPNKLPEWTNVFTGAFAIVFSIIDWILSAMFMVKPDVRVSEPKKVSADSQNQKMMLEKVSRLPYAFQVRVLVGSPYGPDAAKERLRNIIASFKELEGPHNGMKREFLFRKERTYHRMVNRHFSVINNDDVLSTVELAGFCHLPNKKTATPGLKKIQSKRSEVPQDVASENAFAVGVDNQGNTKLIGLDENARMRHVYVSGMYMPSL